MTANKKYEIDHWNREIDGELSSNNLESKLTNKYGHKFYRYEFDPSFSLGNHTHAENKADAILSGKLEMIVIDRETKKECKFVLGPGDIFYLPANVVHRARVVSDENCVFYDSYK